MLETARAKEQLLGAGSELQLGEVLEEASESESVVVRALGWEWAKVQVMAAPWGFPSVQGWAAHWAAVTAEPLVVESGSQSAGRSEVAWAEPSALEKGLPSEAAWVGLWAAAMAAELAPGTEEGRWWAAERGWP